MKNTEARKTAKTVIGFVLVLVLLGGALFGIDVPYDLGDVENVVADETKAPAKEETQVPSTDKVVETPEADEPSKDEPVKDEPVKDEPTEDTPVLDEPKDDVPPVEDTPAVEDNSENVNNDAPVEDTNDNVSTDNSATDETITDDVDASGDAEVTEPTEDDNTVTEGDNENA